MLLVLVGLLVIAIPVALAARTVARVVRVLGGVDAHAIAAAVEADDVELDALATALERDAPGSVAQRLVSSVTRDSPAEPGEKERPLLERKLALGEEVADIERSLAEDARVPRVAASLASTGGLLAAALVMREGLGVTILEGVDPVPLFLSVIDRGLTLAAIAVFGGIACAALHRGGQQARRARLAEVDALVGPLSERVFGPDH